MTSCSGHFLFANIFSILQLANRGFRIDQASWSEKLHEAILHGSITYEGYQMKRWSRF